MSLPTDLRATDKGLIIDLYLVFVCPKCGSLRYAREGQKRAVCFKCSYQIPVDPRKIRIVYKTAEKEQAIDVLQKMKMKQGKIEERQTKLSTLVDHGKNGLLSSKDESDRK
jgi:DNA-directed RNA polymerase subunit M/transcription elongation factor TFIIS